MIDTLIKSLIIRYPTIKWSSIDNSFKSRVDSFLLKNEFLKQYPNYVQFLKRYGGLSFIDDNFSFNIYGFDKEVTMHLEEGEGDLINEDGFFCIGDYTEDLNTFITKGFYIRVEDKLDTNFFTKKNDAFDSIFPYVSSFKSFSDLLEGLIKREI